MTRLKNEIGRSWVLQARAHICSTFPGYRFEDIDRLTADRIMELLAAAEWLAEQQERAAKRMR